MTFELVFALSVLVLVGLAISGQRKHKGPYQAKALLTANEREFYARLQRALPNHTILAQVAMGALLQPRISDKKDRKEFFRVRSAFAQKIVDYVVCDADFNVLAVIELDDRMHDAKKDSKRDAMMAAAGYRTLRFNSRQKPSEAQLSRYF